MNLFRFIPFSAIVSSVIVLRQFLRIVSKVIDFNFYDIYGVLIIVWRPKVILVMIWNLCRATGHLGSSIGDWLIGNNRFISLRSAFIGKPTTHKLDTEESETPEYLYEPFEIRIDDGNRRYKNQRTSLLYYIAILYSISTQSDSTKNSTEDTGTEAPDASSGMCALSAIANKEEKFQ